MWADASSTGYLQDAVAAHCKRQRVEPSPSHDPLLAEELQELLRGFWNSNEDHLVANLNFFSLDGQLSSTVPFNKQSYTDTSATQLKHEQLLSPSLSSTLPPNTESDETYSNSSSHKEFRKGDVKNKKTKEKKKKGTMKLLDPFKVVKQGGIEGDITLEEINARILMNPTRPIRHPVGEYAFVRCLSFDDPGLSGKAIVGLRRIHTQGKGTITIIRTRG